MPIYRFKCSKCKEEKDAIQSFSAHSPICCSLPMERLISASVHIRMDNTPSKFKRLGWTPPKSYEPGPHEV